MLNLYIVQHYVLTYVLTGIQVFSVFSGKYYMPVKYCPMPYVFITK